MGHKDLAKVKWRRRERKEGREAVVVARKMKKLQRLVPGGSRLKQADLLFLRTAQHILQLRFQVQVLQALSKMFQP